jgi:hypothetical protein
VLLSSGDSFPHLIQKPRSQLGFVTYLLNYLRIIVRLSVIIKIINDIFGIYIKIKKIVKRNIRALLCNYCCSGKK